MTARQHAACCRLPADLAQRTAVSQRQQLLTPVVCDPTDTLCRDRCAL
jgi:hypothetical protein